LNIAGAQEVPAFLWTEGLNNAADPAQQAWNCVLGCLAQMHLEFAEGLLDGVEVWQIGRQIKVQVNQQERAPFETIASRPMCRYLLSPRALASHGAERTSALRRGRGPWFLEHGIDCGLGTFFAVSAGHAHRALSL